MRSRFGVDFSAIRVHTDSASAQMCKEVGAKAFAVGNRIYYGLIKEKRYNYKPGKEKDWNYMSTEARFRCVAGSTDRDLKEKEVHLGHESGKGESQHWNGRISGEKPGHAQTKKQNQEWHKNSNNYRGPE